MGISDSRAQTPPSPPTPTLKISSNAPIINSTPEWRNWQTRRTQNPVAARPCGFDPLLRHHRAFPVLFVENPVTPGNVRTRPHFG